MEADYRSRGIPLDPLARFMRSAKWEKMIALERGDESSMRMQTRGERRRKKERKRQTGGKENKYGKHTALTPFDPAFASSSERSIRS